MDAAGNLLALGTNIIRFAIAASLLHSTRKTTIILKCFLRLEVGQKQFRIRIQQLKISFSPVIVNTLNKT